MLCYFRNRVISLTGVTENYIAAQGEYILSRNKSLLTPCYLQKRKELKRMELMLKYLIKFKYISELKYM